MKKNCRIFTKTKLTDVPYYLLIYLQNFEQDNLKTKIVRKEIKFT